MRTLAFRGLLMAFWMVPWSFATSAENSAPAPAVRQFQRFKIGSYSAIALKDGGLQMPNDGKAFVVDPSPTEVAEVLRRAGVPTDYFQLSIQPLLVRAASRVLLFDTGAGTYIGAAGGKLSASMVAAGVKPASVTDIFISHVHGDHVGGLLAADGTLAFPAATIHMSAAEWQWLSGMTTDQAAKMLVANHDKLVAAVKPKIVAFEPGAVILPGVLQAVDIKGHTPGHSGYLITSGSSSLLYIGDTMHHYIVSVQQPEWKIAFDNDQATAAASRVAFCAQVAANGQLLYAVHFPFPGVGKIARREGGTHWVPAQLKAK